MIKKILLVFILIKLTYAEDMGVVAKTYPIVEPDMIDYIKNRAKQMMDNGQWDAIKKKSIANAKNKIENPTPIAGIEHTKENKTFYYNPMFQLKKDLTDANGNLIAKAGWYNPLTFKPFNEELIFIDGNDPIQVSWAIDRYHSNTKKTKIILTSGSFLKLDKKYKVWFYYDQNGFYTSKFGIAHVPAIVNQAEKKLKVDEIRLPND